MELSRKRVKITFSTRLNTEYTSQTWSGVKEWAEQRFVFVLVEIRLNDWSIEAEQDHRENLVTQIDWIVFKLNEQQRINSIVRERNKREWFRLDSTAKQQDNHSFDSLFFSSDEILLASRVNWRVNIVSRRWISFRMTSRLLAAILSNIVVPLIIGLNDAIETVSTAESPLVSFNGSCFLLVQIFDFRFL